MADPRGFKSPNFNPNQKSDENPNLLSVFPIKHSPQVMGSKSNERQKVALQPGYSALDWASSNYQTLSNQKTSGTISTSELSKHCKIEDCWIALDGRVYDATRYVNFHPGDYRKKLTFLIDILIF
ncbi:hypothetical protein ROZALSC1DRAFT_27063 [Rozella allomycis CSF55]|uniref:Cytochrome b5 heme-binding domain-containing protein n=1 Tax=Rozella allomycis (strain CSF55) TaxID=988480 RepID=A0A4P9YPR7_ROZAC|nr:hypothetical protein ROZALSC1DRAFT_27063 [Rozella allomycis CSF55]